LARFWAITRLTARFFFTNNTQKLSVSKVKYLAQRRKGAKNKKFEARKRPRGPKFETISNVQNMQNSKQASFGFGVLDFSRFEIYLFLGLFLRP